MAIEPLEAGRYPDALAYIERLTDYMEELSNRFAQFHGEVAHHRDALRKELG